MVFAECVLLTIEASFRNKTVWLLNGKYTGKCVVQNEGHQNETDCIFLKSNLTR